MFTERELALLKTQRLLRLATVAADGQPDADAVGFVFDGSVFIIGGHKLAQSRKYRNVHGGNHKVSLILDVHQHQVAHRRLLACPPRRVA